MLPSGSANQSLSIDGNGASSYNEGDDKRFGVEIMRDTLDLVFNHANRPARRLPWHASRSHRPGPHPGGAFGNPMPLIWTAIEWALDEAEPYLVRDLEIVVNGRNLPLSMRWAVLAAVKRRDGAYVTFTSCWLDTVQR